MSVLRLNSIVSIRKLVLKEILNSLVRNHLLVKDVSACLGASLHLYNLCVCTPVLRTFMEGCDSFLCHFFSLFII